MKEWTLELKHQAIAQGWNVSATQAGLSHVLHIERVDDPDEGEPIFSSDDEAMTHVRFQAQQGCTLAITALHCIEVTCRDCRFAKWQRTKNGNINAHVPGRCLWKPPEFNVPFWWEPLNRPSPGIWRDSNHFCIVRERKTTEGK